VAWQTSDTTMNASVKRTARGESVVVIEKPKTQLQNSRKNTCRNYVAQIFKFERKLRAFAGNLTK